MTEETMTTPAEDQGVSDRQLLDVVLAPFTPDQVRALNDWQQLGHVHEFTCGNDGCRAALVATVRGWICPFDDYTQDWAHGFMADASRHPKTFDALAQIGATGWLSDTTPPLSDQTSVQDQEEG